MEIKKDDSTITDKSVSFAQYFDEWFRTYKENKISYITAGKYRVIQSKLAEFYGSRKIDEITRRDYQRFINEYGACHAPESVKKTNSIIRSCVKSAILDDLITKDFTQNVELVWNSDREHKVDYLNVNEINKLAAYLESKLDPRYTSYYMIYTAIMTGMRLQEIAALTWDDINFNWKTIDINKAWDFVLKKYIPTKTESSTRIIRVNSKLLDIIAQLKSNHSGMVFCNASGTIPTSLLYKGVDIYAISKRLGHSDLTTTTRRYAYLIDELRQKADDDIENILNNVGIETSHRIAE